MIGVIDMKMDSGKSFRLLKMYEWLNRGDVINKKEFAEMFGISEKSVQRDIEDLRAYIAENVDDGDAYIEYDQTKKGVCAYKVRTGVSYKRRNFKHYKNSFGKP